MPFHLFTPNQFDNRTKLFLDQFFIQEWECLECKWTEINLLCFSATLLVWKGLYTACDKNKAFFKHNIVFFISQCVLRRRSETKKLKVWSYLHFTLNVFGKFNQNDLHWDSGLRMISSHIPWNSNPWPWHFLALCSTLCHCKSQQ